MFISLVFLGGFGVLFFGLFLLVCIFFNSMLYLQYIISHLFCSLCSAGTLFPLTLYETSSWVRKPFIFISCIFCSSPLLHLWIKYLLIFFTKKNASLLSKNNYQHLYTENSKQSKPSLLLHALPCQKWQELNLSVNGDPCRAGYLLSRNVYNGLWKKRLHLFVLFLFFFFFVIPKQKWRNFFFSSHFMLVMSDG